MFSDSFNPKAALAATSCPRCHTLGLTEIDAEAFDAAPPEHRHQATAITCPSLTARCPACLMVMEWPGCCE